MPKIQSTSRAVKIVGDYGEDKKMLKQNLTSFFKF